MIPLLRLTASGLNNGPEKQNAPKKERLAKLKP